MSSALRYRKHLEGQQATPAWSPGVTLRPITAVNTDRLHAILAAAYSGGFGEVPPREQWWPAIVADAEYDADLVFVAADQDGQPIGLALCWTSGFIKDLAVDQAWRGRGIATALLQAVFSSFVQRGLSVVDLKVKAHNAAAIRLYQRLGMVEAPL